MAGASSAAISPVTEEELTLTVKWSGKQYTVGVCGDDSVEELKRRICEVTNVLPKRQKLLCPKIGSKLADDSILLSSLPLKSSLKMTMIGMPEIEESIQIKEEEPRDIHVVWEELLVAEPIQVVTPMEEESEPEMDPEEEPEAEEDEKEMEE